MMEDEMTRKKKLIGSLLLVLASMSISHGAQAEEKTQSVVEREYEAFLQRPVAKEDIQILKRADEILSNETIWDRNGTRKCYRLADSWNLFCALHEACIEVTGKYDHRRVAIEEVRFVIEDEAGWFDRLGFLFGGKPSNLPCRR